MHAGKKFGFIEALTWTRRDLYSFTLIAAVPTGLYQILGLSFLALPWVPIALVGTAVAFLVGFKNNASYDRLWEARQIWGGIVNDSRTWGIFCRDYVTNRHASQALSEAELHQVHQRLIYRHLGWLTALRYQLRQPKAWENTEKVYNQEYRKYFRVIEQEQSMDQELKPFLSPDEFQYVLGKQNRAAQILSLQSKDLKGLLEQGLLEDFRHMELGQLLKDLYAHQGKSERIKNFPYPRQFATLNYYFVWLFLLLLPFGMLNEFSKLGDSFVWLTIPFSAIVSWVFHTMEKIGEASENPFEGSANDIPITALSRTIEIDLREMLEETDLPKPIEAQNQILL